MLFALCVCCHIGFCGRRCDHTRVHTVFAQSDWRGYPINVMPEGPLGLTGGVLASGNSFPVDKWQLLVHDNTNGTMVVACWVVVAGVSFVVSVCTKESAFRVGGRQFCIA